MFQEHFLNGLSRSRWQWRAGCPREAPVDLPVDGGPWTAALGVVQGGHGGAPVARHPPSWRPLPAASTGTGGGGRGKGRAFSSGRPAMATNSPLSHPPRSFFSRHHLAIDLPFLHMFLSLVFLPCFLSSISLLP